VRAVGFPVLVRPPQIRHDRGWQALPV